MIASPEQRWRGRDPRTQTARRWPSAPGTARANIQAVRRELSARRPTAVPLPTRPGRPARHQKEPSSSVRSGWSKPLASTGRVDEAPQLFADLLELVNPLGLLPEEINPKNHGYLGNVPQPSPTLH
jgi:hypothetical protein